MQQLSIFELELSATEIACSCNYTVRSLSSSRVTAEVRTISKTTVGPKKQFYVTHSVHAATSFLEISD